MTACKNNKKKLTGQKIHTTKNSDSIVFSLSLFHFRFVVARIWTFFVKIATTCGHGLGGQRDQIRSRLPTKIENLCPFILPFSRSAVVKQGSWRILFLFFGCDGGFLYERMCLSVSLSFSAFYGGVY